MNHMDSAPIDRPIQVFGVAFDAPPDWYNARLKRSEDGPEWNIIGTGDYVRWPQGWREIENG